MRGWSPSPNGCREPQLRRSAGRASDGLALATISPWELASLFSRGVLRSRGTVESAVRNLVENSGVNLRPITPEIAALAMLFPPDYPRDPVDRIIGAVARAEGMALVTRDERIRTSPLLRTVW